MVISIAVRRMPNRRHRRVTSPPVDTRTAVVFGALSVYAVRVGKWYRQYNNNEQTEHTTTVYERD